MRDITSRGGRRWLAAVAVMLVVAVVVGYRAYRGATPARPGLVTAAVTRGDVVEQVDATGKVQAVTTVQVGTQVSGTIKSLRADFNARVRRGQVIAELEPSLYETQVEQARATVARLEAEAERVRVQRDDREAKLRRARELAARKLLSDSDLEAAEMAAHEAQAAVRSADAQVVQGGAALNQAKVNLAHTVITAPIAGIVISRNVDIGQTVAASMQAPTLYVLAADLTVMQVNASVSEADIGRIALGQLAHFRVDAYPDRMFSGLVTQVRLEPVVEQNVVSYVTVIDVANSDLALKPGMTATVTVESARALNVLRVPLMALRLRPSADVLQAYSGTPASGPARGTDAVPATSPRNGADGVVPLRQPQGRLWVLAGDRLHEAAVVVGINDGQQVAILDGPLQEGAAVVTGITGGTSTEQTPARSPLLPAGRRGGGGLPR